MSALNEIASEHPELAAAALAAVVVFVATARVGLTLEGAGIALAVGCAAACLIVGAAGALRRLAGKEARGLPLVSRVLAPRRQWPALLGVGLFVFAAREGAFAPELELDLAHFTVTRASQTTSDVQTRGVRIDDGPEVRLAHRTLRLSLPQCLGDGEVCAGFLAALPDDLEHRRGDDPDEVASLSLLVTPRVSGACMMPLSKSAEVRLRAEGSIHGVIRATGEASTSTKTVDYSGTHRVRQSMWGPASCRLFRRLAGASLADSVLGSIRRAIAND